MIWHAALIGALVANVVMLILYWAVVLTPGYDEVNLRRFAECWLITMIGCASGFALLQALTQ